MSRNVLYLPVIVLYLLASSVDGEGHDADIESPRSPRDNCLSSCENSLDERGSNRGSLLRVIRGICCEHVLVF